MTIFFYVKFSEVVVEFDSLANDLKVHNKNVFNSNSNNTEQIEFSERYEMEKKYIWYNVRMYNSFFKYYSFALIRMFSVNDLYYFANFDKYGLTAA